MTKEFPEIATRAEEDYPAIVNYEGARLTVEFYPGWQVSGTLKELIPDFAEYDRLQFAQKNLMDIEFCSDCKCQIKGLPSYFAFETSFNQGFDDDSEYHMPEIILNLCEADQQKFYHWITTEVYFVDYPGLDVAIKVAQMERLETQLYDARVEIEEIVENVERSCESPQSPNSGTSATPILHGEEYETYN